MGASECSRIGLQAAPAIVPFSWFGSTTSLTWANFADMGRDFDTVRGSIPDSSFLTVQPMGRISKPQFPFLQNASEGRGCMNRVLFPKLIERFENHMCYPALEVWLHFILSSLVLTWAFLLFWDNMGNHMTFSCCTSHPRPNWLWQSLVSGDIVSFEEKQQFYRMPYCGLFCRKGASQKEKSTIWRCARAGGMAQQWEPVPLLQRIWIQFLRPT